MDLKELGKVEGKGGNVPVIIVKMRRKRMRRRMGWSQSQQQAWCKKSMKPPKETPKEGRGSDEIEIVEV